MIREEFPPEGSQYEGGLSDGYQYQIRFRGSTLQGALDMVRTFLMEEGYGDVPLPKDAEEMLYFRLPTKQQQISMFHDNGYSHNPIRILFDPNESRPRTLIVCLFDEKSAGHLLKFHNKISH